MNQPLDRHEKNAYGLRRFYRNTVTVAVVTT